MELPLQTYEQLLEALTAAGCQPETNGSKGTALCPGHDDAAESFSFARGNSQAFVIYCHAGCSYQDMTSALKNGLRIYPEEKVKAKKGGRGSAGHLAASYEYCDESGRALYRKLRFEPKGFVQQRWTGIDWEINLDGVETVPFRLNKIVNADTIYLCEGEKAVLALEGLGLVATCTGGANSWRQEHARWFAGANVIILPDNDEPGEKYAAAARNDLEGVCESVVVVRLPGLPEKGDAHDWVRAGGTTEELEELVYRDPGPEAPGADEPDPAGEELERAAEEAEQALQAVLDQGSASSSANPMRLFASQIADRPTTDLSITAGLSQTSKEIVNILIGHNEPGLILRKAGGLVTPSLTDGGDLGLLGIDQPMMTGRINRVANVRMFDGRRQDWTPKIPPAYLVSDVMKVEGYRFPTVEGIVFAPVVGPSGKLTFQHGYDTDSRWWIDLRGLERMPKLSDKPSKEEVGWAVALIVDSLADFPFENDAKGNGASGDNLVALGLLPYMRPNIQGETPLHLINAPIYGSGKTLAQDAALIPALGRRVITNAYPQNEDEMEKRLLSVLVSGRLVVSFDNIPPNGIDSPSLAMTITSGVFGGRVLGTTNDTRVPARCIWAGTGNNPQLSGEIARRTVEVRLVPDTAEPWNRRASTFRHPQLRAYLLQNREVMVWAYLTLVQNWIAAGSPSGGAVFGSCEDWAEKVSGVLMCAGDATDGAIGTAFLGNRDETMSNAVSSQNEEDAILIQKWYASFGTSEIQRNQLWHAAHDVGQLPNPDYLTDREKKSFTRRLTELRDKVIGGFYVRRVGQTANNQRYRLEKIS